MELSVNELRDLVTALSQSDIAELTLKSSDFELTLRKQGAVTAVSSGVIAASPVASPAMAIPAAVAETTLATPPTQTPTTPLAKGSDLVAVPSPMVGTFYRSPGPEESPFVSVGDRISAGQAVCIIEAMKLMNEIEAEVAGEIVEILVENAEPVEFGQTLMLVRPT